MDIKELNRQLKLTVPDLPVGYMAVKRIGKGGVGEGVYRCRNPRIVLKLQYTLKEFAKLHEAGVLNNGMFPRVYKLVTEHKRYDKFPYHLLWRESCQLPPLVHCKTGWGRGFTFEHFTNDHDRVINEARRLVSSTVKYQVDNDVYHGYKLPGPWKTNPPAELVYLQHELQQLKSNPSHWNTLTDCSTDIHLYNFGFVYRGRGAKRTRRIVFFDPVVH